MIFDLTNSTDFFSIQILLCSKGSWILEIFCVFMSTLVGWVIIANDILLCNRKNIFQCFSMVNNYDAKHLTYTMIYTMPCVVYIHIDYISFHENCMICSHNTSLKRQYLQCHQTLSFSSFLPGGPLDQGEEWGHLQHCWVGHRGAYLFWSSKKGGCLFLPKIYRFCKDSFRSFCFVTCLGRQVILPPCFENS